MQPAGLSSALGISLHSPRPLPAILLALCVAVPGIALVGCADHAADAAPEAETAVPTAARRASAGPGDPVAKPRYIGAAGCAAAMCHGGGGVVAGEATPVGSEYTVWLSRDPHAHAYAALLDPLSVSIVRNMRASPQYADLPEASEASICLTCHSISPGSTAGEPNPHGLQGGVSCEACHGPAEHWLEPHKRADWKTRSAAEKESLGLWNTQDVLSRVKLCSECHVGGRRGDVNHDLIAAGHPRMAFEFAAYQTNMPAHWDVTTERRAALKADSGSAVELEAAYEAKLWAVGQVTVARQALVLLQLRAGGPAAESTQTVWPEFSEWNCYDCHHHLEAESWRQRTAGRPGQLTWGTWTYPLLPLLSAETGGPDLAGPDSPLRKLEREMIRVYPDRKEVTRLAAQVVGQLDRWAVELNGHTDWSDRARPSLVRVITDGPAVAGRDWDGAAQTYLALSALANEASRAQAGEPTGPMLQRGLDTIREALRFGTDDDPDAMASPPNYADRLDTILGEFSRLQSQLGRN